MEKEKVKIRKNVVKEITGLLIDKCVPFKVEDLHLLGNMGTIKVRFEDQFLLTIEVFEQMVRCTEKNNEGEETQWLTSHKTFLSTFEGYLSKYTRMEREDMPTFSEYVG